MSDKPETGPAPDPTFYNRADAVIELANSQLDHVDLGKVSASLMFAAARYNAWVSANGFASGPEMATKRAETIEYFTTGYRQMLELHLDQYIENFDVYMRPQAPKKG